MFAYDEAVADQYPTIRAGVMPRDQPANEHQYARRCREHDRKERISAR